MEGYIKLHRQMLDWEWYDDANTMRLFIHCLLRANHKDTKWRGLELKKGSFLTSYEHLSKETGLTVRQVRYSLSKLKMTNELSHKGHSSYSIITVNNWNTYQVDCQTNCQTSGRRVATDKNDKKDISNISYINVSLSIEEREILKNYVKKKCKSVVNVDAYIHKLIQTGDYKAILEKANKNPRKEIEDKRQEDILKVKDINSACVFIGKYGDFTNENHPKEVIEVMQRYGFQTYDDAVIYQRGK